MPDLGGILVGGRGRRMGGVAKGMLTVASGETLIARWTRLFAELGTNCVLVGRHEAYIGTEMECLADDPPDIGPLGGLIALLARAGEGRAIAVACDMPYVPIDLLAKLASHPSNAPIVAPRRGHWWEPLFARYDAARVLGPARERARAGHHSLQGLLDEIGAQPLPLDVSDLDALRDWDRPEDRLV
jgi:molybdopterin-guanine dinucleotide biosynthesis protein A